MFLPENTFVESALEAEFKVDLDLSGAPGLGLEVDWADGKTLLIKSIKASGEWFGEVGSVGFLNEKLVNLNNAQIFQADESTKKLSAKDL